MKLTQKEKRIKIAEACGWRDKRINGHDYRCEYLGGFHFCKCSERNIPPDYFNDLNAMHEAEKTLGWNEQAKYYCRIYEMAMLGESSLRQFNMIHATAPQRFEALGLTLELWGPGQ